MKEQPKTILEALEQNPEAVAMSLGILWKAGKHIWPLYVASAFLLGSHLAKQDTPRPKKVK